MPDGRYHNNPDFRRHEHLLVDLHRLIAEGQGDSADADRIRDDMEARWWQLSDEEQERLEGLSADLYALNDEEVWSVVPATKAGEWRAARDQALENGRWAELVQLLRHRPADVHPIYLAWLRYRAYAALGEWEAAAAFAAHCLNLRPQNQLLWEVLSALGQAHRYQEAQELGTKFRAETTIDIYWLIQYVSLLRAPETGLSARYFDHAATELRRVLATAGTEPQLESVWAQGYLSLAICERALGQTEAALAACRRALEFGQADPALVEQVRALQAAVFDASEPSDRHISASILDYLAQAPAYPLKYGPVEST
jgi:tetratricopeptide (TPR) repeat protein